jgi:hypothetical protein
LGTIRRASDGLENRRELERDRIQPRGALVRRFAVIYLINDLCHRARHTCRRAYTLRINIEPLRPTRTPDAPLGLFSRHYTLRYVPKPLSQIFDRRSRPWAMAAGLGSTSHTLSTPNRSCSNESPQISPLSYLPSSLSTSPFDVSSLAALRCLVPSNLYDAAGTRIASRSLYALSFDRRECGRTTSAGS